MHMSPLVYALFSLFYWYLRVFSYFVLYKVSGRDVVYRFFFLIFCRSRIHVTGNGGMTHARSSKYRCMPK